MGIGFSILNSITNNKDMTYENYKKGMFRVFIVLSIPLELVTYFQYDLSFANKIFYGIDQVFYNLSPTPDKRVRVVCAESLERPVPSPI